MFVQGRSQMQTAKEVLQKLAPAAEAASQAAAKEQAPAASLAAVGGQLHAEGMHDDDNSCIVWLDQPSGVGFSPCGHCVTCAPCAELLVNAKQPCPLCRGPAVVVCRQHTDWSD